MTVTVICVVGVVVLGVIALVGAWSVASPASAGACEADARRRRTWVTQHPTEVNSGDIHAALVVAGLPRAEAAQLVARARELGVKPFTMWLWIQQHGADALQVVVGADLGHAELLGHLGAGTVPDLQELRVFARLNGYDLPETRLTARTAPGAAGASAAAAMPQVLPVGGLPAPVRPASEDVLAALDFTVDDDGLAA